MNRPYIRRIWGELHWFCFVFIFLALGVVQTVRGVEFLEDLSLYVFFAPWLIFVVVDRLITGKLTVFPWKRKDADRKVVNDERDGY